MAWMIGRNHCTVPTGRLQLGSRTSMNVHFEKTTVNNFGGCGGMSMGMMGMDMYNPMNMGIMGMGMYNPMGMGMMGMGVYNPMDMMGMGVYGDCYGGGAGTTTTIIGGILNSIGQLAGVTGGIINAKKSESKSTEDDSASSSEIKELKEQVELLKQEQQKRVKEIEECKELSKLYQEGISKDNDGKYVVKVKDKDGKTIELKGETPEEVRKLKKEHEAKLKAEE